MGDGPCLEEDLEDVSGNEARGTSKKDTSHDDEI